jgi:hypothetical protein
MTETPFSPLLSIVSLSDFSPLQREPQRPAEFRTDDFNRKFDSDVLIYDAFRRRDGKVVLLGPPLFNLEPLLRPNSIRALPGNGVCAFRYRKLDRHMQIVVEAPADCASLSLDLGGHRTEVVVGPNLSERFAGRRVLLTKTKNNDPAWIRDWVSFNQRFHGADALLLYDNLSDPCVTEALKEELGKLRGLEAVEVLSWPFKFGPQGLDARRFWDSDFCELGALEHARWRLLAEARSVQTGDVDELLLSASGRSVFIAAEKDLFGVVRYRGRWIVGTDRTPVLDDATLRRHAHYDTVLRRQMARRLGLLSYDTAACPPKWTVVPRRCPEKAQWGVHRILNWLPAMRVNTGFCYRHFREITSNWKYDRLRRDAFDPALHEIDHELIGHFARWKTD